MSCTIEISQILIIKGNLEIYNIFFSPDYMLLIKRSGSYSLIIFKNVYMDLSDTSGTELGIKSSIFLPLKAALLESQMTTLEINTCNAPKFSEDQSLFPENLT